jgi:serine protease inhibitor
MRSYRPFFLLIIVAAAAAAATWSNAMRLPAPVPQPAQAVDYQQQIEKAKTASTAINAFGFKLLSDVTAHQQHRNVFLSPLSVFTAMAMTEGGAGGKTREALRAGLSVPSTVTEDQLHDSASALLKSLQAQKGAELAIANALWSDPKLPLDTGFIERCRKFYEADATTLNFESPGAANTINNWVKEHTRGKIPTIVTPEIVRAAQAILTNAVYFKGRWEYQFPKGQTKDGEFHLANGRQKKVPMMHHYAIEGGYRSGNGFEAAALPYKNTTIELYAILPAPGKSPEEVMGNLSLDKLRYPAEPNELDLKLPRFTMDFGAALKAPLERMGMSVTFQPGADFRPMGSDKFFISDVLHKTRLEVDEEGTVAAAATATVMAATAVRPLPKQKKVLVFDRPFGIVLCDLQTGAVLFAGVVYEP